MLEGFVRLTNVNGTPLLFHTDSISLVAFNSVSKNTVICSGSDTTQGSAVKETIQQVIFTLGKQNFVACTSVTGDQLYFKKKHITLIGSDNGHGVIVVKGGCIGPQLSETLEELVEKLKGE